MAEANPVAGRENPGFAFGHVLPVDLRAVGRAEIGQKVIAVLGEREFGVLAGDRGVLDLQGIVCEPPHADRGFHQFMHGRGAVGE